MLLACPLQMQLMPFACLVLHHNALISTAAILARPAMLVPRVRPPAALLPVGRRLFWTMLMGLCRLIGNLMTFSLNLRADAHSKDFIR